MRKIILILLFTMLFTAQVFAVDSLKGKKILIEGDSIQANYGKYMETAVKTLKGTTVNHARNGATLGERTDNNNSVYYRISKMKAKEIKKYDYIFICAGTNDYGYFENHGKITRGSTSSTDSKTTLGALNLIINKIQKASSATEIVVVTPIHKFSGWKKKNYKNRIWSDCDELVNRFGYTLQNYRTGLVTVAKNKGVHYIKGNAISTKKEMGDKDKKYTSDFTHPKKAYAKTLSKRAVKKIKAAL